MIWCFCQADYTTIDPSVTADQNDLIRMLDYQEV
jgi:hypothetical protein